VRGQHPRSCPPRICVSVTKKKIGWAHTDRGRAWVSGDVHARDARGDAVRGQHPRTRTHTLTLTLTPTLTLTLTLTPTPTLTFTLTPTLNLTPTLTLTSKQSGSQRTR
jgi:hypothetical protein